MGINVASDFSDTNDTLFNQETVSVGTSEVEAKCAATDLDERQFVRIFNNSNQKIYFGPAGVTSTTGEPLLKKQSVELALKGQSVFMVVASGSGDVIVTDIG